MCPTKILTRGRDFSCALKLAVMAALDERLTPSEPIISWFKNGEKVHIRALFPVARTKDFLSESVEISYLSSFRLFLTENVER